MSETFGSEESRLRGRLITENSQPIENKEASELKGKLLEQVQEHEDKNRRELSALRGSLVEDKELLVPYSEEWLKAHTFIQRDSGEEFTMIGITDTRHGKKINLKDLVHGANITLDLITFVEKLQTSGSPWRVKED